MKKQLSFITLLSLSLAAGLSGGAAAEETVDYSAYAPGVTVEADENSPTGYKATFVYAQQESYEALSGEITKVRLYSDCMNLFDPAVAPGVLGEQYDPHAESPDAALSDPIPTTEYRDGLFTGGGSGDVALYVDMENLGEGLWGAQVYLPSGAFVYNFELTDEAENVVSRLDDPSNPTLHNEAAGTHSLSSMVYVPYDEVQGKGMLGDVSYADRSVELPRGNRKGKVETVAYTSASGAQRGLAIYLPYGYSENRSEPYKVLYLSHGASGDATGNELRWVHEGDVANIMDNLIATGKTEPFVVVTMDNQIIDEERWNYDKIWAEHELIMAYMEENYNVAAEQAGRAYAGLSMGGITTSNMLLNHPELFSYYGIWSAANTEIPDADLVLAQKDNIHLMYGGGLWDFGVASVSNLAEELAAIGLEGETLIVPGAHDWETWQLIYAYAAENFFWKADAAEEADSFDYTAYEKGYTVFEDAQSPTGYSAVFVYEEQPSYEGLTGEVASVDFFSKTMMLFSYDSMPADMPLDPRHAYYPEDYQPGLFPAGGDTDGSIYNGQKINYYADMTEFAEGLWGVKIPVFSGAYDYNFQVFDTYGNASTGSNSFLYDPNNLPMQNATGDYDRSSMFYVPYKAETMGEGQWIDRSLFIPRTDDHVGTLQFDTYESENGTRDLGIYLPYGYDAEREEPYKVLYMSHGQQSELEGDEMRWLAECAAVNIMDNLEADFIVVTMNNKNLNWDENLIWDEAQNMIAYMEENYNVSTEVADRAFAGFSMGGFTTQRIYFAHPDAYGYFGIWSFGMTSLLDGMSDEDKEALAAQTCKVQLGAGDWDYLLHGAMGAADLCEKLAEIGVEADWVTVPASHDWGCWQMLFANAVENFFWK